MRNSSEPDWDGPRNLRDALQIAISDECNDYGVLLCLSDSINAASEATKQIPINYILLVVSILAP